MTKASKLILILIVALSVCLTAFQAVTGFEETIDQVAGLQTLDGESAYLATYKDNKIELQRVDHEGITRQSTSFSRSRDGKLLSVRDMSVDSEGVLYLLFDCLDPLTGASAGQEVAAYDLSRLFRKQVFRHTFEPQSMMNYRWISVSSSVVLIGTSQDESLLTREAYDTASLYGREMPQPVAVRTYNLPKQEGIYQAVVAGSDLAFSTKSGKIYLARESEEPREIYPNRVLTELMYPLFLEPQSADAVYLAERSSGDLRSLSLADGTTTLLKNGTEPFSGVSGYAPVDVRALSMVDPQNFTALAPAAEGEGFVLLSSSNGSVFVAQGIRSSMPSFLLRIVLTFLGCGVLLLAVFQLIRGYVLLMRRGQTILVKLIASALPLLLVALAVFGIFSYRAYSTAIEQSFRKQVEDEGNLLTALFGSESFNEIEYPYDYTSEAYTYLKQQMATRQIHTATAYYEQERYQYEREDLFVGVDFDYPCFYPFDIRLNSGARSLYELAAYTGKAQTGVIEDVRGPRIVCITPVGGASGGTVYLLETGILTGNLERYTSTYLRGYVLVSLLFLGAIGVILLLLFRRILMPIREIRTGLEAFAQGDRSVRLETAATDEFSGIVRVFNKMAGDIDAQLYSLRLQSETYFRFIPRRMLQLLGKDNLGEVELGSGSGREYPVLCVDMRFDSIGITLEQEQELTNRFFNILNRAAEQYSATLMTDSVNLRRLRVVCPGGGADAVEIALSVLAEVDLVNAGLPMQNRMKPLFVAHYAQVYYGICGDEERLVPALLSRQLDFLEEQGGQLRQFGCRLLVTEPCRDILPENRYARRFIGYVGQDAGYGPGLYHFYDETSPEETRLLDSTRITFDKAMSLFLEGRWQEAKNLFALVLRENQYDDVSRYYVFLCEKNL